jgi:hypothetical protein
MVVFDGVLYKMYIGNIMLKYGGFLGVLSAIYYLLKKTFFRHFLPFLGIFEK